VGRLEKEKRIEVIIRALPLILKKTDAQLVLVGPGSLKDSFKKLAEELGVGDRVIFPGFIPDEDLPNFYRAADVFVIAGIAELQSIATMEAMASGLPVIACNAMALPELAHEGENAFLFSDGDHEILTERAILMLTDHELRKRMSQKSLEIIAKHEIDKIMSEFEALYQRAIKQYASHPHEPVVKRVAVKIKRAVLIPSITAALIVFAFLAAELKINVTSVSASVIIKKTPKEVITQTYQRANIKYQKIKTTVHDKMQYIDQELQ
jgi:hypothetical protein